METEENPEETFDWMLQIEQLEDVVIGVRIVRGIGDVRRQLQREILKTTLALTDLEGRLDVARRRAVADRARMSCARMRNIVRLLRRAGRLDDTAVQTAARAIDILVTIKADNVNRNQAVATAYVSSDLVDGDADAAESPTIDGATVRSMIAPRPSSSETGLPSYPTGMVNPELISPASCPAP